MKIDHFTPPEELPEEEPARQYLFIDEHGLQDAPTVRGLAHLLPAMAAHSPCEEVLERFLDDHQLRAIPLVDSELRPIALVDRQRYVEFLTKPYCREIFGRLSVVELLRSEHFQSMDVVVIDARCTVDDAAKIIIDAGMEYMVTGFVISKMGKYLGVGNGHDLLSVITQRRQAELYYLAHYDQLTEVPNRLLFGDRLAQACRDADREGALVGLLFVDVDRFKQINDSFGHRFGDEVLRSLVGRLKQAARRSDTVARIGGDEFVILMEHLTTPEDANKVAERLVDSMRSPIEVLGHSLLVTVSIGIATYPNDDRDISRLLAKADAAMYEAKAKGRNGFCLYHPDSAIYNPKQLSLEQELRRAIDKSELSLVFQPQVDLVTQTIKGVEALVRWHHPTRGMVSPVEFIPAAEASGLIVPMGNWVLREACRQLQSWIDVGVGPLRMSVNISAVQFRQQDFVDVLAAALAETGTDPAWLELELTESVLMQNVEEVIVTLNRVKAMGVSLAIDDFGTGFSSLNYLRRFPIDRLKIDQSFIRDIEETPANASITKAIIALAESLDLGVVAEGIEKTAEKAILENLGCLEGQGYFFARPLSPSQVVQWIGGRG